MEENGKNYQLCEIEEEISREMFKIASLQQKTAATVRLRLHVVNRDDVGRGR
jgi:hypothetical protein